MNRSGEVLLVMNAINPKYRYKTYIEIDFGKKERKFDYGAREK